MPLNPKRLVDMAWHLGGEISGVTVIYNSDGRFDTENYRV